VFARGAYAAAVTMPLNIAYLAGNLRKHEHQVEVLDGLGEDINHIATSYAPGVCCRGLDTAAIVERTVALGRIDGIGVTATFSQDWPHVEEIILALHARFPATPIIVGGEHATAAADFILESCAAVSQIAMGEGEDIIVDFADWLDGKLPIEAISGVVYRAEDGSVRRNPPRPRQRNPDDLPWPAWDLFDLNPYFETGEGNGVDRGRAMPLLATRGCPYQCTFCSSPLMWTTRYVMRDAERVVDEIEHYVHTYGAQNFDFADLTAIIKKSWILDFCRALGRRGIRVTWQLPNGTRSEAMDAEVLQELAAAGCTNVTYAPESGSERTLRDIKKRVSLPRMFASIREAKRVGIFVKCNLVIGFPRETRADILRSVATAFRFAAMGVDDTGLFLFSPYPGSELFTYLQSTGRIGKLDRDYFVSLMSLMDLQASSTYCEKVGPRELAFYRLFGMAAFYGLSYLLYPRRITRTIRNYRNGRSDTLFEERLFGFLRRLRLESQQRRRSEHVPAVVGPAVK